MAIFEVPLVDKWMTVSCLNAGSLTILESCKSIICSWVVFGSEKLLFHILQQYLEIVLHYKK